MLAVSSYQLIVVVIPSTFTTFTAFVIKIIPFVARDTTRLKYRGGMAISARCPAMINTTALFIYSRFRVREIELRRRPSINGVTRLTRCAKRANMEGRVLVATDTSR